jgi:hypothetical protein
MAGLDPAIHDFLSVKRKQDVDHRVKPGDDERIKFRSSIRTSP